MALSDYDKKNLSAAQQAEILALTEEYTKLFNQQKAAKEAGNTGLVDSLSQQMSGLHDQAEAIRSGSGYSGGDDGTAYIEAPKTTIMQQPASANTGKTSTTTTGTNNSKSSSGSSSVSSAVNVVTTPAVTTGTGLLNGTKPTVTKPTVTTPTVNQTPQSTVSTITESAVKTNPDSVMSAEDQARVEYFREIYNDAKAQGDQATMDAAHKAAEDIRQGYGYSGGVDGSQYITEGIEAPAGNYKDAGLSAESQKVVDDARLNYYIAHFNDDMEEMDRWHEVAEEERAKYGYSGGEDGSEYIPVQTAPTVTMPPVTTPTETKPAVPTPTVTTPTATTPKEDQTPAVTPKPEPEPELAPVPEIVLPDIPAFSNLTVPDLVGIGTPVTPDFDKLQMPTAPEFETLSIPTAPDVQINDYSQYIQEMQDAQLEAALAEYEAAYQQNVNAIDRAGVGVNTAYQNARNQTAGAADLASRNFAEIANASGLSSGTGGQAALSRSVAMQNNLHSLNMQQTQTMADLEQQISNNETWYNSAIAQAEAEGDSQTAQLLYQEKIRVESETVAAVQQKFANEITLYQKQMDAEQQQFVNETSQYKMQMEAQQQQFANEVAQYQQQMDAAQQQFANEVSKKQLEYQELRDSVADVKWQAQFDLAYDQWLEEVQTQQAQMAFEREQWETGVAIQREQMDTAYEQWLQSVATEQAQMDFEREKWEQNVAAQDKQLTMQRESLDAELKQMDISNDQWQQSFDASNDQWQQEFDASLDQWKQNFDASMGQYNDSQIAQQKESLAGYGKVYLQAGVMPSDEMLAAMGITAADAQKYIASLQSTSVNDTTAETETPSLESTEDKTLSELLSSNPLWNIANDNISSSPIGQLTPDSSNTITVDITLSNMKNAGANMTEMRAALRDALNNGLIDQSTYDSLAGKYLVWGH